MIKSISSISYTTRKNNRYVKDIINIIFNYMCVKNIIILNQCNIRTTSNQ